MTTYDPTSTAGQNRMAATAVLSQHAKETAQNGSPPGFSKILADFTSAFINANPKLKNQPPEKLAGLQKFLQQNPTVSAAVQAYQNRLKSAHSDLSKIFGSTLDSTGNA